MPVQLRLLDNNEHRETRSSIGSSLPESVQRDVREQFADLLVVIMRSRTEKERSNELNEDHAGASGA
jgi:hypothetical protein